MSNFANHKLRSLASLVRTFIAARGGNIGLATALMIAPMVAMAGAAVDYAFAVNAQGKLEEAAKIAATQAATSMRRAINSYTSPTAPAIDFYDQAALNDAVDAGYRSFDDQAAQLKNVTTNLRLVELKRVSNTITARVTYTAFVNTFIMKGFGFSTIKASGEGKVIVGLLDEPGANPSGAGADLVINETWDRPVDPATGKYYDQLVAGGAKVPVVNNWYSGTPGGTTRPLVMPTDTDVVNNPAFKFAMRVGHPQGFVAPILSKKVYLQAGDYELRYWYRSTLIYPDYEPAYVCGSVESEMNWAISGRTRLFGNTKAQMTANTISTAQTTRAGVYLQPILTNPQLATDAPTINQFIAPPALSDKITTKRADNSANRLDICAYSGRWIERSIPLKVTASGYFWLSFVAEKPTSTTDLNGFYLGPIKLCSGPCTGAPNNNSPWPAYDAATQSRTLLFSDSFEIPQKTAGYPFSLASGAFAASSGYENPPLGWFVRDRKYDVISPVSPDNTTIYFTYGAAGTDRPSPAEGSRYVRTVTDNAGLARQLLLLPGYYRLTVAAATHARPDPCDVDDPSAYDIDFQRSDYTVTQKDPTLAPPGTDGVHAGTAVTVTGCGTMVKVVVCYRVTGTQFYQFMFGSDKAISSYVDPNGVTRNIQASFDDVTFEFLSNDFKAGFPDPQKNCSFEKSEGSTKTTVVTTLTVAGGSLWPGDTVRTLDRVKVTAPLP